ncbi:MAG TPA: DUF4097 family beta strand repeat-containing protein [Vicinamibacterales bacterium]|nr:DUF4097 family beta strand repeat-containing protein [Vicinamibacterales bacterium]
MRAVLVATGVLAFLAMPSLASAQRFRFERTIQVSEPVKLDVDTVRGKIEVRAGAPGRVVVEGDATVRVGFNVPANAVELARQVAASPPIEQSGNEIRLRTPSDSDAERAVTIAYRVQVPPGTEVDTTSDSGETTIEGIAAPVSVRTQSAPITVRRVAGNAEVSTGSGAVVVDDVRGDLTVTTSSSSFRGTGLGGSLRLRTQSGDVQAAMTGAGEVEVQTGSSAIQLSGLGGALSARTESGRVTIQGAPGQDWSVTTGSSAIDVTLESDRGVALDAASRGGEVVLEGMKVDGSITKRAVDGTFRGGGPRVRLDTRSGTIRIRTRR